MKTNIKLFNFLGSSVNLDIFLLFIFLIFPITMSLSIFISVLIHEMAHAFIANKKGYYVYGINIMSKIHFNKCRGKDIKKLADIKTRVVEDIKGVKNITWKYSKILS
jgi:hypothetical protein